jgi:hypothetical protein
MFRQDTRRHTAADADISAEEARTLSDKEVSRRKAANAEAVKAVQKEADAKKEKALAGLNQRLQLLVSNFNARVRAAIATSEHSIQEIVHSTYHAWGNNPYPEQAGAFAGINCTATISTADIQKLSAYKILSTKSGYTLSVSPIRERLYEHQSQPELVAYKIVLSWGNK